jgi:hypothetical protein
MFYSEYVLAKKGALGKVGFLFADECYRYPRFGSVLCLLLSLTFLHVRLWTASCSTCRYGSLHTGKRSSLGIRSVHRHICVSPTNWSLQHSPVLHFRLSPATSDVQACHSWNAFWSPRILFGAIAVNSRSVLQTLPPTVAHLAFVQMARSNIVEACNSIIKVPLLFLYFSFAQLQSFSSIFSLIPNQIFASLDIYPQPLGGTCSKFVSFGLFGVFHLWTDSSALGRIWTANGIVL